MSILRVENLSAGWNGEEALSNISFEIEKGDSLAIIGPNGSGKTTLLKAIIGIQPYQGKITAAPGIKIGYVPQKLDLERKLPITIKEFLELNLNREKGKSFKPKEVLSFVALPKEYLAKKISVLSAGEFQRVLIAAAIINRPELLLFDEPTASVDIAGQETVYQLLHRLEVEQKMTLILVSHDLTVVYRYAKKVLCLNHNQVCFGVPQKVLTPEELQKLYGSESEFYHHH